MRRKYDLPNAYKLNFKFDLERLQKEVLTLKDKFIDVYMDDPALFSNSDKLAVDVHDIFRQVNLTIFNENKVKPCAAKDQLKMSKSRAYKERLKPTDPRLDEHNYDKITELFRGTYMQEVVNKFKSSAIRVRLTKLPPYTILNPHIDYDPTYAIRVIIPIFSNSESFTIVWRRNKPYFYNLKATGEAYFLNIGLKHAVAHMGKDDRINLMISLETQEDIDQIPLVTDWKNEDGWNG